MKERILGIDAGTNSLGWAIVDYDAEASPNKYQLIDKGVNVFQEGVKIEKGIESSRASERTGYKHQRVGYWRRKIRKIALLTVLRDNELCPNIPTDELRKWRLYKVYPQNKAFVDWQRTDEETNKNPYYYRNLCLTEKLDLSDITNRYKLGRAIYHLNQRRGFLSNRKEDTKAIDGAVSQGIDDINAAMAECGCEYLGQYFYQLYQKGERIRKHYTHRIEHYEKELLAICRKQGLSEELTRELRKIIITQRPLKSQKHAVGHCVFEKNKTRCPSSHPLYEQYRLFSFLNNIKVQTPRDESLRFLTTEEKRSIIPLFLRKSKKEFKFEEIAKKLSGTKNNYCYYKSKEDRAYKFNYHMDTSVSGCPVIAQLSDAFDVKNDVDEWLECAIEVYTQGVGKNRYEIMNDIWHALFFFEDAEHLKLFAKEKLQLDDEHADKFAAIKLPQDYAQLSLKAIRKILPYMKNYGMIYSHAAFLANITKIVDAPIDKEALLPMLPKEDADDIVNAFYEYDLLPATELTREKYVKTYILRKYNMPDEDMKKLDCLYHPSMIETFPKVRKPTDEGYFQLDSPRTNSVRNPMAMHSLFRLRHVINTLLAKGKIDEYTKIRIEFARELNDSNRRAAIRQWQRENENRHKEYADKIKETMGADYEPTPTGILKYKLWEEQEHICLYTGEKIGLRDLFDPNKFDIEHTIPRSVGGDSTEANLTICQARFNREVKKAQMPSQLANHEDILERIAGWQEKVEDLDKQLRKINTRGVSDIDMKNRLIQKKHKLQLERDYWHGKVARFTMTEVPEGFARRQGVDISVISRYARLYLKSLFHTVNIVKGIATADFRKIWGLQEEYTKKERVNHCHHAIDAITIACIGKAEYDQLAQYYHDEERHRWGMDARRAVFPKPWATFTEDIKHIEDSLVVSHYTRDNMPKHTRKRIRGRNGEYMQGDTARGSLHLDTIYGAIKRDDEIRYVVRRPLDSLSEKDLVNIVDDAVRQKIEEAITAHGTLKKAVEQGIWMNKEKGVAIKKVRCYAPSIKRPIELQNRLRDVSAKEYKRSHFVANDLNYVMGIYVGVDKRGKEKREFEIVNNLDSAKYFRRGNDLKDMGLLPIKSEHDYLLKWTIKPGTMVLLYEESPKEIYELNQQQLVRRLYKVTGLSSMVVSGNAYGTIALVHSQEARPSSDVKLKNGAYSRNEELRPGIKLLHTQFRALVEGVDFTLDEDGEIKFLQP